ncbi:MAG: SelT/SelW/SelH family protein [Candidatus Brocadiae bacterium]|nr:SelT/SelW/SelH family protein [Candidatus Brocadiia bacterium]
MSETIKKQFGVSATLVPSSGGVFEVYQDDKLIFSKKQTNRFPTHEEVLKSLSNK